MKIPILWILLLLLSHVDHMAAEQAADRTPFAQHNPALTIREKADNAIKYGLLLRSMGQYEKALECYLSVLTHDPKNPLADKIKTEVRALQKLCSGQRRLIGDPYELDMEPLRRGLHALNPEYYQPLIDDIARRYPERWEPLAFSAQNQLRLGQLESSEQLTMQARSLGGEDASIALFPIIKDLHRRIRIREIQTKAHQQIHDKQLSKAAATLESAWNEDPELVEFGVQAACLHADADAYRSASALCLKLVNYLKQNPTHPMAAESGKIQVIGEKCQDAIKMTKKPGPAKTTTHSGKPRKKAPSPLDLYKQRTR